jgi:hypothetical protein
MTAIGATTPAYADGPTQLTAIERLHLIGDYAAAHPDDAVGLQAYAKTLGGDVSASTDDQTTVPDTSFALAATASDGVTVSGFWVKVRDSDGLWYSWNGVSKFSGGDPGSSAPNDALAIQLKDITSSCFTNEGTSGSMVVNLLGGKTATHNERVSIKNSDFDSTVFSVNDHANKNSFTVSGSMYYKQRKQCEGWGYGKAYYEHNRDGNGSWSAKVTVGVMELTYSGSDKPVAHQESTGLVKVNRDIDSD